MNRTLLFALLTGLALALSTAADADDCRLKLYSDIGFETASNGMALLPVSVNGQRRTFLIDTGAAASAISASTSVVLDLTPHKTGDVMELFGGVKMDQEVVADSFSVGKMNTLNFPFILAPSDAVSPVVDGLLGANVLHNYDVEFDFAKSRFKMFSPDHCDRNVVYWTSSGYARVPIVVMSQGHISVSVMLDGQPITAILDTGSETSVMSLERARAMFGFSQNDPRLKAREPAAFNGLPKSENYLFPFQTLTFEGVAVHSPDILLLPARNMGRDPPPLLLGIGVLRQLHLYIAYKEQALYVTGAEAR